MASDWTKMRTDLYRDPKVCLMADSLLSQDGELADYVNQNCQRHMTVTRNVTRNAAVGALVTVWGVTRHRGKRVGDDLVIRGASISIIDDISDLPGLGEAMRLVGWALETDEGLVLPSFFKEFNVEPVAENKSKAAERQRRYREKRHASRNVTRDVTPPSQSNAREEKRREEIYTPTPFDGNALHELGLKIIAAFNAKVPVHKRWLKPQLTDKLLRQLLGNLESPPYDWEAALAKFPLKCGIEFTLSQFLESGRVEDIIEGKYDWVKSGAPEEKPRQRLPTPEEDAAWTP